MKKQKQRIPNGTNVETPEGDGVVTGFTRKADGSLVYQVRVAGEESSFTQEEVRRV